jgi:hypothetical protein
VLRDEKGAQVCSSPSVCPEPVVLANIFLRKWRLPQATCLCNLGLAQKNAGMLGKALGNYTASIALCSSESQKRNVMDDLVLLKHEIKQWTGGSGYMTPE